MIGRAAGEVVLVLDKDDTGYIQQSPTDQKHNAGKSNNRQIVRIPKEMQVPVLKGGRLTMPTAAIEQTLNFSAYGAYSAGEQITNYCTLVGWGEGQLYLTGTVFHAEQVNNTETITVRSRYLGPAFHRPYFGTYSKRIPWDISFYFWNSKATGGKFDQKEKDDTERTLRVGGYILTEHGVRVQDISNPLQSLSNATYWSKEGEEGKWVSIYLARFYAQGRLQQELAKMNKRYGLNEYHTPSGYDIPRDVIQRPIPASNNPKAFIRTFSDTPLPRH